MSKARIHTVSLSEAERHDLGRIVSVGVHHSREITRARILLAVADGRSDAEIVSALGVSLPTISNTTKRFALERLGALKERPRCGGPKKITPEICAHITAIASTEPPEGYTKWTMAMIADRVVEIGSLEGLSRESVRLVLKKTF